MPALPCTVYGMLLMQISNEVIVKACMHCADSVCEYEWVHMCSHVRACVYGVGVCMCVGCGGCMCVGCGGCMCVGCGCVHVCGVWVHVSV